MLPDGDSFETEEPRPGAAFPVSAQWGAGRFFLRGGPTAAGLFLGEARRSRADGFCCCLFRLSFPQGGSW